MSIYIVNFAQQVATAADWVTAKLPELASQDITAHQDNQITDQQHMDVLLDIIAQVEQLFHSSVHQECTKTTQCNSNVKYVQLDSIVINTA